MPRLASLYFPFLPIERIRRTERKEERPSCPSPAKAKEEIPSSCPVAPGFRPGARWARDAEIRSFAAGVSAHTPLVTARRSGQRVVLAALSREAQALGLVPGMALTQARMLVPGLDVRDADPARDAAFLDRLGLFAARRWTPRAAVSGPDGLWLDLTGVTHLFGGERRMGERILGLCARLGFTARIAVAGTAGAAHALARFGTGAISSRMESSDDSEIAAIQEPGALIGCNPITNQATAGRTSGVGQSERFARRRILATRLFHFSLRR